MSAVESSRVQDDLPATATVTQLPVRNVAAKPQPGLMARFRTYASPPDILHEPRPSLEQLWRYGRWGAWTSQSGPARWFGAAYAVLVAGTVHTVAYTVCWIFERPMRLLVATGIGTLTYYAFF